MTNDLMRLRSIEQTRHVRRLIRKLIDPIEHVGGVLALRQGGVCPFCGEQHSGDGRCSADDGTVLRGEDGYIARTS
jgi:hypothetical protein